jgi:hypothetical protein
MRSVNLKVKHERKVTVVLTAQEMRQIIADYIMVSPGWPQSVVPEFIYPISEEGFPTSMVFVGTSSEERDSAPPKAEIPRAEPTVYGDVLAIMRARDAEEETHA